MLTLQLCTDRKQNTKELLTQVCSNAQNGIDGQLILVPEQFSHAMERRLCTMGGDTISRYAEVFSFSRLASRLFSVIGGVAENETDASGQLMLMSRAVEQVQSRLKLYGTGSTRPELLLQLLDTLDELRSFRVSPDTLRKTGMEVDGVLAVKLEEFALLLESYEAACANMGQNPETKLNRLLFGLERSDFAKDRRIYIDCFVDFNGVERDIITQMLLQNADITVALHCDSPDDGAPQFEAARDTAKKLLSIAGQYDIPHRVVRMNETEGDAALRMVRELLFSGLGSVNPDSDGSVSFLEEQDIMSVCRTAAGEILSLIQKGYRWRDFTVACPNYEAYRSAIEAVFRRAEIPAYFAGDTGMMEQPMVRMILSALTAATEGMSLNAVLNYLKSGFLSVDRELCDRLENYAFLWNVQGTKWEKRWSMNPYGFQREEDERARQLLSELNSLRVQLIQPLITMRDALRRAKNTADMVLAVHGFMEDIFLNEKMNEIAVQLQDRDQLQRAQEYAQVYTVFCGLLEQMYGILGSSVRTVEEFCRMLRVALSRCSVGTIPAGLDCVSVGDMGSQRQADTPVVFILGADEGDFPRASDSQSLLTDGERAKLVSLGFHVKPTAAGRLDREVATISSVLNAPSQRLIIGGVRGKESYYLKRCKKMFPNSRIISGDLSIIRHSSREYLTYLSTLQNVSLEECDKSLWDKLQRIVKADDYAISQLSENGVKALYGSTLRLSSSKIDCLASCRFFYFLQYGLRAKERKEAKVDPSLYGTFVHDVLEHTSRDVMALGGFHKVSLEQVLDIAKHHMDRYTEENLTDLFDSARAEYLFRRNYNEVQMVVRELYEELSVSKFEPAWFELHFAAGERLPAIQIVGEKMTAKLEGFVDRADVWRDGDRVFVRVVDYKTGKKSFDYAKILNGMGLQMLLYLFALELYGEKLLDHALTPAGVLYFPARIESISLKDKNEYSDSKRHQKQRRSGLLLEWDSVLQAMEPCEENPIFLPYQIKKDGERTGDLASMERLGRLKAFVFRKVAELGDELYSGLISPNPYYYDGKSEVCGYCPYKMICGGQERERIIQKIKDPEFFWKELEKDG